MYNANREAPPVPNLRFPCQKTLIDWILSFAAQYLKQIQKVKLTGYIKTETKRKWEGIYNDKSFTDYTATIEDQKSQVRSTPKSAL